MCFLIELTYSEQKCTKKNVMWKISFPSPKKIDLTFVYDLVVSFGDISISSGYTVVFS